MKLARSALITARHATVVFCTMLVLLATVSAQKQTPTRNAQTSRPQDCQSVSPKCGATLDVEACYTLQSDVHCGCGSPLVAITIDNNGPNNYAPVLNLNGHRISCCSKRTGSVGVELAAAGDELIGPGTITGCDTGVLVDYDLNTVTHVHVIGNNTGISTGIGSGNQILANTLRNNSCIGISSGEGDSISNNLITGSNAPVSSSCHQGGVGIYLWEGYNAPQTVQGNAADRNRIGLYGASTPTGPLVSENDFSQNSQQGAYILGWVGCPGNFCAISGNSFNNNGSDGLYLNDTVSEEEIANNYAYNNKGSGIVLCDTDGYTGASPNVLTNNVALGNKFYDLDWDGIYTSNWLGSTCDNGSSKIPSSQCVSVQGPTTCP